MRFSRTLLALPAVLACAAAVGCHQAQHVKYNPDGTAEAVEAPVYTPVKHEAAPPPVEVIKEPAPAPKPVEAAPAPKPVAKPEAAPKAEPKAEPKAAPKAEPKAEPKAGAQTHVVAKGDTLQKISQKYYGTTKKWPSIMKANNMKDDKIRVGQKLVLPEAK